MSHLKVDNEGCEDAPIEWTQAFEDFTGNSRTTRQNEKRPSSGQIRNRPALAALFLFREIIDQHVLAQMIGARVERAAAIDLGHLLHEGAQARRVIEHEGVDGNAFA